MHSTQYLDKKQALERKLDYLIELLERHLGQRADDEMEELSLSHAAKILHVSTNTLKKYAYQGLIPFLISNGRMRFRRGDIKAFQESRLVFDGRDYFRKEVI